MGPLVVVCWRAGTPGLSIATLVLGGVKNCEVEEYVGVVADRIFSIRTDISIAAAHASDGYDPSSRTGLD